jgi:hypothetical protein
MGEALRGYLPQVTWIVLEGDSKIGAVYSRRCGTHPDTVGGQKSARFSHFTAKLDLLTPLPLIK